MISFSIRVTKLESWLYSSGVTGRVSCFFVRINWICARVSASALAMSANDLSVASRFNASVAASTRLLMSIRQFVSLADKRALTPALPMARLSWSSGTTTTAVLPRAGSSSRKTPETLAGLNALAMNAADSEFHSMMSIFSSFRSRTMD